VQAQAARRGGGRKAGVVLRRRGVLQAMSRAGGRGCRCLQAEKCRQVVAGKRKRQKRGSPSSSGVCVAEVAEARAGSKQVVSVAAGREPRCEVAECSAGKVRGRAGMGTRW